MMKIEIRKGIRGYVNDSGLFLPSVHAILDVLQGAGTWLDEEMTETGRFCHEWMRQYFIDPPSSSRGSLDAGGRLFSLLSWVDANIGRVIVSEQPAQSSYGYAGTPDLLAIFQGKEWIIDFKFTDSLLESYWVQLAAYTKLDDPYLDKPALLLQVTSEGKVHPRFLAPKYDPHRLFAAFLSARNVLQWRTGL